MPPVRFAISTPASVIAPAPVNASEAVASVIETSAVTASVSLPDPALNVSAPPATGSKRDVTVLLVNVSSPKPVLTVRSRSPGVVSDEIVN